MKRTDWDRFAKLFPNPMDNPDFKRRMKLSEKKRKKDRLKYRIKSRKKRKKAYRAMKIMLLYLGV